LIRTVDWAAGAEMQSPNQSGIALVIVLWVLALLAVIAVSFTTATRSQGNLVRNLVENAKAEALADAGVYRAVLGLLTPRTEGLLDQGMENLLKLGTESPAVARRRIEEDLRRALQAGDLAPEAEPMFKEGWRTDGTVTAWSFGGAEVRIAIRDEGGKIDLNRAPDELLRGLFLSVEWTGPDGEAVGLDDAQADALTDAVRDFADPDDLRRLNGAEDADYAAAGLPWDAKDAPFAAIEELQQVLGMTPVLYEQVAPALTVHTGSKGIDPKSAPREVLLALPGSAAEAVDAHLAARAEAPEGAGPASLGAEGFTARSRQRVYTVRAEAYLESGAVFVREAVVRLGGGERGFRIEAWKKGERPAARHEATN
jgi:general secretion pathway protein K